MTRRRAGPLAAFRPTPAYLTAAALFLLHQGLQKGLGVGLPLIDDYLDPLLSIPLLLGLAAAEQRWLLGRGADEPFTGVEVLAMTTALALLFEEGFPRIDPARQTRDPWDYLAYATGGLAYYWLTRPRGGSGVGRGAPGRVRAQPGGRLR